MKSINNTFYISILSISMVFILLLPLAILIYALAYFQETFFSGIFFQKLTNSFFVYSIIISLSVLITKVLFCYSKPFWLFNYWFSSLNNIEFDFVKSCTDRIDQNALLWHMDKVEIDIFKKYTRIHPAKYILDNIGNKNV